MTTPRPVPIARTPIQLGQFLKLAGVVGDGAEAKVLLAEVGVDVNGEPEHRRGRKLDTGDLVTVGDETLEVTVE